MGRVQTGMDVLLEGAFRTLRDVRVGILSHQASVDSRVRHIVPLMSERGIRITALFAPEHGFWGTAQDQIPIASTAQAETSDGKSVHVHSLYGDRRAPTAEMLADIDVLICDLQDVGSRYYTFVWTMALAMQACAKYGKRFIVLDRPNPINGETLEGPTLDPNFASFVGLYPVPVRHGLTIGEMALWVNEGLGVDADLEVIPMKGWRRSMYFEDTGVPWVLPSPNMPTVETAVVYPGGCLIEGTHLSEGRGTTRPFELSGAPYIDPDALEERMAHANLAGVAWRACRFEPTFHKFKEQSCGGVQIHVTDREKFKPFLTTLTMIQTIREMYPKHFAWRPPPYEYETERLPFDILCGNERVRETIEAGRPLKTLAKEWQADNQRFNRERKPFLLYN